MIPLGFITEWRKKYPWPMDYQVEQDLLITKILVEIYGDNLLRNAVAFRGGTALHKLFLKEPIRYSEDIDLVQVVGENIGPTLDRLRKILDPWLGKPTRKLNEAFCKINLSCTFGGSTTNKIKDKN